MTFEVRFFLEIPMLFNDFDADDIALMIFFATNCYCILLNKLVMLDAS